MRKEHPLLGGQAPIPQLPLPRCRLLLGCLSDAPLFTPPQAQVCNFKRENEALRSGQGASLTVVKQNTDMALQNLRMVMDNSRASIK